MMSRITINLKKQALEDTILVGSGVCASGIPLSTWHVGTRSWAGAVESTMRSIAFRSEPASYFEHVPAQCDLSYQPDTRGNLDSCHG